MTNEKQLDAALEKSLRDDSEFLKWFLSKTQSGSSFKELLLLRADYPWGKFRAILPNPSTGAIEAVSREAETDVLLVVERTDGKRIGFHIENKLASGRFTPYQPEMYAVRAEAWRKKSKYANYDEWETVLVAPQAFFNSFKSEARKFISFIPHEELAKQIPVFANTSASEA